MLLLPQAGEAQGEAGRHPLASADPGCTEVKTQSWKSFLSGVERENEIHFPGAEDERGY